jgi:hypothetical protein
LQLGHAYDAQNREVPLGGQDKQDSVKSAKTALELYKIIGWVVLLGTALYHLSIVLHRAVLLCAVLRA